MVSEEVKEEIVEFVPHLKELNFVLNNLRQEWGKKGKINSRYFYQLQSHKIKKKLLLPSRIQLRNQHVCFNNPILCLRPLVTWLLSGNHSSNKIVAIVSDTLNSFKWFKVNREIIIFGKIKKENVKMVQRVDKRSKCNDRKLAGADSRVQEFWSSLESCEKLQNVLFQTDLQGGKVTLHLCSVTRY